MTTLGPGDVIAIIESLVSVLPREIAWTPGYVQRRSLELDFGHAIHPVISIREEGGCAPPGGFDELTATRPRDGRQGDFVATICERCLVQQIRRIRLGQLD